MKETSPFIKILGGCLAIVILCACVSAAGAIYLLQTDNGEEEYPDFFYEQETQLLEFSPLELEPAKVGQAYTVTITVTGNVTPVGAFLTDEQTLPPGLTLAHTETESTATLSGTPTEAGEYTFTIDVWCYGTNVSGQTGQITYTLTVEE